MSRPLINPVVPSREADRWLYETLRRLQDGIDAHTQQIAAIDRGEAPSLGGSPLVTVQKHSDLLNLVAPFDDHTQYALLAGRVGGQTLNGGAAAVNAISGSWANGGNFTSKNNKTSLSSWSGIAIDTTAAIGDVIVLALSTLPFSLNINSVTSNHTALTDTKGNTWTKQKEHSFCDAFGAGACFSVWTCTVTSALTAGVDTLTATFVSAISAQAISSHRFIPGSNSLALAGITTLGEQSFVGPEPSALTLSGLSSDQYLFVRHSALGFYGGALPGYTATTNYTAFDHGQSGTSGGSGNVASFGEYRIMTSSTGDTSNPAVGGGGSYVSIYLAFILSPTPTGSLVLRSQNSNAFASKITLTGQTMTVNADFINFQAPGTSTTLSYIRGSDGALIDKLILGTEGTTDPGAGNYLTLVGFNNAPIAGTTGITSRSGEILISKDVNLYVDNFLVVERNTSYNAANGFSVATGLGFVNVTTVGTQTITGDSGPSGALLEIDHTNAGLTIIDFIIKKRASQTGDMTEWQDSTGTKMSYIRASDGAFVGPIVVTGTDTHLDNVFQILDNADNTKIAMFEASGIATATTRTYTLPNVDGKLILSTGPASTAQTIGTFTPTGVANADDLALSGRLMIATSGSWTAGQNFRSTATTTTTIGTINAHQMTLAINASGSSNATYRALLLTVTGGASITSGAPVIQALNFTTGITLGAGVNATEIVALDMIGRLTSLGAGSTCGEVIGLRAQAQGLTTNIGDTYVITNIFGIKATLTSGTGKTTNVHGIELYLDTTNKIFGYTNTVRGIDLDHFGDTTTTWGSTNYTCTVTNGSNILTGVTNVANIHTGQLVTKASIPAGTYVTTINVGAGTVTLNNNATANDTSVNIWGTTKYWSGIFRAGDLPSSGEVVNARFIDNQSASIPSQHVANFYFAPTAGASVYPLPTARVHIGASLTSAGSAPLKFDTGALMTTAEAGAFEFVTDDLYFTITTGAARKGIILNDGTNLVSGRVPFATTNGRLIDHASFLFSAASGLTLSALNIITDTTTGLKLATATNQKLGFWNTAPIIQPTTGIAAATFVANTSGIVDDSATFDGYTIGQVVKALRNMGLLA